MREEVAALSPGEPDVEPQPDPVETPADADEHVADVIEARLEDTPAEPDSDTPPIDERSEGFDWAETVEAGSADDDAKLLGEDSLETPGEEIEDSLAAETVEASPADHDANLLGEDSLETPGEEIQDSLASETVDGPADLPTDPDPEPEPVAEAEEKTEAAPPPPPPPVQKSSFWPALMGGVIAALLGFVAGRGDMLDAYFPRAEAPEPVDLAPLTTELAGLAERVGTLEAIEPVEPAEAPAFPEIPDVSAELGDLAQSIATIETTLQAVSGRVDAVEARPVAEPPAPPVDNSAELDALQSSIAELEARLAEEDARASAEAERQLARAALTRVVTAVESGEAFAPALGALEEVTPVDVPDALRAAALEGVPTIAALREGFPEAARAGLAAARAEVPESEVQGIGGFLRRQLSVRSVMPREGSDPDAVLSRAEAALRSGDLDAALTEADALPEAAKAAMQDWLEAATARKDAGDAAKALADSLTVN